MYMCFLEKLDIFLVILWNNINSVFSKSIKGKCLEFHMFGRPRKLIETDWFVMLWGFQFSVCL